MFDFLSLKLLTITVLTIQYLVIQDHILCCGIEFVFVFHQKIFRIVKSKFVP